MFTTRLISGIVLVIIAAFLLVEGSTVLYFGSMAISLIGLYELYRFVYNVGYLWPVRAFLGADFQVMA